MTLVDPDHVQISRLFVLKLKKAPCIYKHGSVAILTDPTLVMFLPSYCIHILGHIEINSTRRKYSRKYSISITKRSTTYIIMYLTNHGKYWRPPSSLFHLKLSVKLAGGSQ